jgi:hypothetical protein
MKIENPFIVYSPEEITHSEFKEIFVKEFTWINALETPTDFFVYGARGSGKSMLLNYLEISHQIFYYNNNVLKFLEDDRRHKYIGIMVHIKRENLDTDLYELLIKNNFSEEAQIRELCLSDILATILYKILHSLTDKTSGLADFINSFDGDKVKSFCQMQLTKLDNRNIHNLNFDQFADNASLLDRLSEIFIDERKIIYYYVRDKFQIKSEVYNGNYISFDYFHKFIIQLKRILSLDDFSFYILLDNGDKTKRTVQLCINSLIAQREHRDICFKVAVDKSTEIEWDKNSLAPPHDYKKIDIDELYSTQHTVYYIGSAEGHEYPNLQVGDEVNPRRFLR